MSNTRNGGPPPGEAPVRKRRKKRRPGRGAGHGRSVQRPAASGADGPSRNIHHPPEPAAIAVAQPVVAAPDLRGAVASSDASAAAGADSGTKRAANKKRGRRWRNRRAPQGGEAGATTARSQPNGNGQRHFRAPVRPAPDVTFDPARAPARVAPQPAKRARRADGSGVFAALDLGTNNCRLLVAAPLAPGRFRVVDAFSRIVRLGEGMAASGRLAEEAMARALEALSVCAAKLSSHSVVGKRLIATEACRRAQNGSEFLSLVQERTGLQLEIVDRETEARLAAEGCGSLMDREAQGAVLFDIGGGSTELVLVRRAGRGGHRISGNIAGWTSLPVGVVTLSERHGGRSVTPQSFQSMVEEVRAMLERFEHRQHLDDIWGGGRTHLLGTSGTVTTIAGVHLQLPRYDRRRVDGIWLSDGEIDKVVSDLLAMDYDARARNPCIGRERADLVLAGCAILEAIRLTWPSRRLRVADRGLREGILNELMLDAGVWERDAKRFRKRRGAGGLAHAGAEG